MKRTLTNLFNDVVHSARYLHATYIDKSRGAYVAFISSAYNVPVDRLADLSRDEMRQIFKSTNSRYAFHSGYAFLPAAWAASGVQLLIAGSLGAAAFSGALALCWAGIFIAHNISKSKSGDFALRMHDLNMKFEKSRQEFHRKYPEFSNPADTPKGPS